MTWFLVSPTGGAAQAVLPESPGGMPQGLVDVTEGSFSGTTPQRPDSPRAPSTLGHALRRIFELHPDLGAYGLVFDDCVPENGGWWMALELAAGRDHIALASGGPDFPLIRNAVAFGGDLVRAAGGLSLGRLDGVQALAAWDSLAEDHGLLRKCGSIVHRTKPIAEVPGDRGRSIAWATGQESEAVARRIVELTGATKRANLDGITVAICIPSRDFQVDLTFANSLKRSLAMLRAYGVRYYLMEVAGISHIGTARERLLWDAMATDATHIMFIDADMGWDAYLPLQLLGADHEFAAAVGVRKEPARKFCCNFFPGNQTFDARTNFLEVSEVGFGFVVLQRKTVEAMAAHYPELAHTTREGVREVALFLDMVDDGARWSEDMSFCRRWRKMGGRILVDPNASLAHVGRRDFTGKVADLFERVPIAAE